MDQEFVTRLLGALGDPNRQQIIMLLGQKGRLNVGEIAGHFSISRPAISHHLKILKDAHIVTAEKQGQETYYSVDGNRVVKDMQTVTDVIASCVKNGPP
jgi:ArsR family transcriptional regulator, arsenate/arsenite/antimonite-responsive transcriptional repressor